MQIVQPYAKMLGRDFTLDFHKQEGEEMLRRIEYYARVSHRSEDAVTSDSYSRFIRSVVLGHGDFSVIEHESVTVEALVDRGITHEWVRHRLGAYTQESTRFVNYQKKGGEAKFIVPEMLQDKERAYEAVYDQWLTSVLAAETAYMGLLEQGIPPQIARSVLPNALASKLIVTYNLRSWRHFFLMRTSAQAHPQMRQVTIPLLEEFQAKIPILFEDIIPNVQQKDNMRFMR